MTEVSFFCANCPFKGCTIVENVVSYLYSALKTSRANGSILQSKQFVGTHLKLLLSKTIILKKTTIHDGRGHGLLFSIFVHRLFTNHVFTEPFVVVFSHDSCLKISTAQIFIMYKIKVTKIERAWFYGHDTAGCDLFSV